MWPSGLLPRATATAFIPRFNADECLTSQSCVIPFTFAARLTRSPGASVEIAWAATCLEHSCGTVPVTLLRKRTGFSRAHFAATFREQVGLTPKRYARVLRFRRALTLHRQVDGFQTLRSRPATTINRT